MTAAAFDASYSDWKLIKTRGVVQIVLEVPIEKSWLAYEVLGGMPVQDKSIWCAVARLDPSAGAEPMTQSDMHAIPPAGRTEGSIPSTGANLKTAFRDMRPANQAGILCGELLFQKFLCETKRCERLSCVDAADYVRRHCNVASRSDIRPRTVSGDRWQKLVDEYRVWMHQPELGA